MEDMNRKRGRKKRTLDISLLADADLIKEDPEKSFFITCSICGSTKNITAFRNRHICIKCINYIKDRS